jgi:hypothetical protein
MITWNRTLGVLSVLPLVYVVALTAALGWWFVEFDPSRVQNARLVVVGFWIAVTLHLAMMALMLALMLYFFTRLRATSASPAEKLAWAVALVTFNFVAYPFFYFVHIRPALKQAGAAR